jgi:glycosyltransferase involved in cell wall biosynthesis
LSEGHKALVSDKPLVTVITAVFNAVDCIEDCIKSVLNQDCSNVEHIIVDGGSNDGTVEVLRCYNDRIALWISEQDSGVFDAWNKGLSLANGEWIAFLGSDDRYMPGAINVYMNLAVEHPEADFLVARARLDHPTGYAPVFGGPWKWPSFATAMTTVHVGAMHRRSLFDRYGVFDSTYSMAADYEFLLRAKENLRSSYSPATTVLMRAGGVSDSTAALREAKRAKVSRGVKSPFIAELELRRRICRFYVRRLYIWLRARFRRQ